MKFKSFAAVLCALVMSVACNASEPKTKSLSGPVVKTGIEVLRDQRFAGLKGKRVGLVTNPSGVDSKLESTIDILFNAPEVNLVALYGPEHGVRGDVYAGGKVENTVDESTGLPVFSLYGQYREPSQEMLKGVDIMVYDIQDVGTRSYTFISTLGLVMRACAKAGIEVMVLDRPNPLGGNKVEGCLVEPGYFSFVSQYRIPYIYGLTVGEIACMINKEGMNCGQKGNEEPLECELTVVPMDGWHRNMTYLETGLPWVLPSPNIPYPQTAMDYPAAGISGDLGFVNIGVGYTLPFETFAAEWIEAEKLKTRLQSYGLPGVSFRTIHYKPIAGSMAGKLLHGVQYCFTDFDKAYVTMVQFYVLQALAELYPERNPFPKITDKLPMVDKVCGTGYIRKEFAKRRKVADIEPYWSKDVEAFRQMSRKYYLYD